MRIGYFGGSFDPPHRGHLAVARAARDRFALDRVLLAPTGRQPLKPAGPEASFADRLRMTELLCHGERALEASAIDAPEPDGSPNYTVNTLRRLRAELGSRGAKPPRPRNPADPALTASEPELFVIVGADAFQTLPKWRDAPDLLRLAQWIVVSRPGNPMPAHIAESSAAPAFSPTGLTPGQRAHIHQLTDVAEPVSATALRTRLRSGQDCTGLLPPSVLEYIQAHGLYSR